EMTPMLNTTGWTLIHFTWQGTLVACLVSVALRLAQSRSARARYAIACAGLCAMLAAPAVTARMLGTASPAAIADTASIDVTASDARRIPGATVAQAPATRGTGAAP